MASIIITLNNSIQPKYKYNELRDCRFEPSFSYMQWKFHPEYKEIFKNINLIHNNYVGDVY